MQCSGRDSILGSISWLANTEKFELVSNARGPVFFAVGTDFGSFSTFWRSVFNMVKHGLVCTGMVDEEFGMETVVSVDGIEDGPGMGWECDAEPVDVDKHEPFMRRCHTIVEIDM